MIGQYAGHRDEVLHLLTPEQALARLGGDGDPSPLQRLFIAPQVVSCGGQQSDIARFADPALAALSIDDDFFADQLGAQVGDGLRFSVADFLGVGFTLFVGHFDIQGRDGRPLVTVSLKWIECDEPRLSVFGRRAGLRRAGSHSA